MLSEILGITETTSFGFQQGIIVAAIFTLGMLIIRRLPAYRWLATGILLVCITPLVTAGFWFSSGELGISDWDYYFSLHHTHRQALLEYHQLPHWNPYICGGTAGVADPEFRFFTPTFLLQLAFGIPTGFRLAIWLSVATGAVGILLLGKRLGLSREAATIAALGATFGTVTLLEIVEGHPNVFAAMYIPWIFWSWLAAYRSFGKTEEGFARKSVWIITTALFLTLTFFQGGIYLLMYTTLAFIVLPFLVKRPLVAITITLASGILALGLASVKLIPVFVWLSQFQDEMYASSASTITSLHEILLGRYIHGPEDILPAQGSGWHEYGAYIGPFVLLLAIAGAIAFWRRRAVRGLIIASILAVLLSSSGPLLKPFFDQAPYLPRSNISRVILFAIIPLSLLAGFGLDAIRRRVSRRVFLIIATAASLLVSADLFSLAYPLSEQAFVLPRVRTPIEPAPEPMAYASFTFPTRHRGDDYTRAYEATIRGYGTFSYCSVLGPRYFHPAVRTIHDEGDNGIFIIETSDPSLEASYVLSSWSPSEVRGKVTLPGPSSVVLNTNYVARGWTVNGQPAKDIRNLVGTTFTEAGEYDVIFRYRTPGLYVGSVISLLTVGFITMALVYGKRYRQRG